MPAGLQLDNRRLDTARKRLGLGDFLTADATGITLFDLIARDLDTPVHCPATLCALVADCDWRPDRRVIGQTGIWRAGL